MSSAAPTIAIQGFEGSNHEIAAWQMYGHDTELVGKEEFADVFQALRSGEVDKAVTAMGNTTIRQAFIYEPFYELIDTGGSDFWVTHRTHVDVRHQLLGIPGTGISEIKSVHSQEPALDQCKTTLNTLLPGVQKVIETDTSLSAKKVHEQGDPSQAAIATLRAGELNHLEVLSYDIQDRLNNTTTFFGLSRRDEGLASVTGEEDRTILLINPGTDDPGVQEHLSRVFRKQRVNLADWHVDSSPGTDGRVKQFYVEAAAGYYSKSIEKTIKALGKIADHVVVLGSWKEPTKPNATEHMPA